MRWTRGSLLAALRTDTVPATAGLMKSSGFSTFQWKGEAVWTIALRTHQPSRSNRRCGHNTHSTPITASPKASSWHRHQPQDANHRWDLTFSRSVTTV
jgi:hypothetical protein